MLKFVHQEGEYLLAIAFLDGVGAIFIWEFNNSDFLNAIIFYMSFVLEQEHTSDNIIRPEQACPAMLS